MATYYLSPSGNDSTGTGAIGNPWKTLVQAWGSVAAGDTIYLRGGTHAYDHMQYLQSRNGTAGNLIKIWGYPGETAVITRSASYVVTPGVDQDLIYVEGNYLHWEDIEIANFAQQSGETTWSAFRFGDSSNCIFRRINYHDNMASMSIRGASSNNLIEDCDFYRNSDPYGSDGLGTDAWDGADGLQINFCSGNGNIIRNCRAWWNCDDGFDVWENLGMVTIENCWSFYNGYKPGTFDTAGNGSGIKLGSTTGTDINTKYRTVTNCLVHKNRSFGIVENQLLGKSDIFNNTVSESGVYGFWFGSWNASVASITNNISYNDAANEIVGNAVTTTNSWQNGLTVTSADFQSTSDSQLTNARNSDGTLPTITFLKLADGSDLINAGTNVGLPYSGSAPDLGYSEYSSGSTIGNSGSDPDPKPTYNLSGIPSIYISSKGKVFIYRSNIQIKKGAFAAMISSSSSGGATGLTNVTFVSTTNLQESPSANWKPINTALDSNGKASVSLPASTDGQFQCEIQSASNTNQFAICWDTSNAIGESYYSTAKYIVFPIFGTYWYNDDLAGAIDSGIGHSDGDLLRLYRAGSVIKAQYYRGGTWNDIHTYSGTDTGILYMFISSAQDGTALTLLNPKQEGAV